VALEAEVIHVVGVTFKELCAPRGDVMNPDTRALDVMTCVWDFHKKYNVEIMVNYIIYYINILRE